MDEAEGGGERASDGIQQATEVWEPKAADGLTNTDEFQRKQAEGWQRVFTDGSANIVKGWSQAGDGGWYGHGSDRNFSVFIRRPMPSKSATHDTVPIGAGRTG